VTADECAERNFVNFVNMSGTWHGQWQQFSVLDDDDRSIVAEPSFNVTAEELLDPNDPFVVRRTLYYEEPQPAAGGEERDGRTVKELAPIGIDNFTDPGDGRIRSALSKEAYFDGVKSLAVGGLSTMNFELILLEPDERALIQRLVPRRHVIFSYDNTGDELHLKEILMQWENKALTNLSKRDTWYNRSLPADKAYPSVSWIEDGSRSTWLSWLGIRNRTTYGLDCSINERGTPRGGYELTSASYKLPGQNIFFWAPPTMSRTGDVDIGLGWLTKDNEFRRVTGVYKAGALEHIVHDSFQVEDPSWAGVRGMLITVVGVGLVLLSWWCEECSCLPACCASRLREPQ